MKINAITVSVDYSDFLAITLPRASPHFHRIIVATDFNDHATARVVSRTPNAELYQTNSFYQHGAVFNKGIVIEEMLDLLRRDGWICILDADIVLPEFIELWGARPGQLWTPRRRMLTDISRWQEYCRPDADWSELPQHCDEEWAGYFQLFHASDPVLANKKQWYGTTWSHAGGCDSDFMSHWPRTRRARPPFEVLHLGEDGKNWCGRVTPGIDGSVHPEADARKNMLETLLETRKKNSSFAAEKIRIPAEAK